MSAQTRNPPRRTTSGNYLGRPAEMWTTALRRRPHHLGDNPGDDHS